MPACPSFDNWRDSGSTISRRACFGVKECCEGTYSRTARVVLAPLPDRRSNAISKIPLSLEAILVDFQRPNLRFQRGPRDAQLGRSPLGSEYPAATFFQGGLNHFLLLRQESSGKLHLVFRFCQRRLLWKPAFIDRKSLRFAKYDRTLDDVLQFADVSRPGI